MDVLCSEETFPRDEGKVLSVKLDELLGRLDGSNITGSDGKRYQSGLSISPKRSY